jgi:hypothetical protein
LKIFSSATRKLLKNQATGVSRQPLSYAECQAVVAVARRPNSPSFAGKTAPLPTFQDQNVLLIVLGGKYGVLSQKARLSFLFPVLYVDRPKHEQKMESDVQTFLAENRACDVRRDIEPI